MIGYILRTIFFKKLSAELTEIELTSNGFSVRKPFSIKPKLYHWDAIERIQFSENYTEVIVVTRRKKLILKNVFFNWYLFIQKVPKRFTDFDFNYVTHFINTLQPCKVCGIVAVHNNECIVCDTTSWNSEMNISEIAYIKLKQREFYSAYKENNMEIKTKAKPEHGFKADKNWKLYISKNTLL